MTTSGAAVRHLGCPACGATLTRREETRTVRCRACGNRIALAGVEGTTRFQIVPSVSREGAIATVRRCLASWPVREGTAARAAIVATELFWVPFHEFEALQAGTVLRSRGVQIVRAGRVDWSTGARRFVDAQGREISESEHYERRRTEILDTAVVLRTHRTSGPAGGAADWGLSAIDLAALRDDDQVRIVPFGSPGLPRGHVLPQHRGRAEIERDVRGTAGAQGNAELTFLASDLRVVFVPVWIVRYRVDRHPYAFVVDAVRGSVLSGRAPETLRRGVLFVVVAASFVGFPVGKLIAVLAEGSASNAAQAIVHLLDMFVELGVLSAVVAIVLLLPLAWAWGEFRFRGEVQFRPDGARVIKLSRPATTWLERKVDGLSNAVERIAEEGFKR